MVQFDNVVHQVVFYPMGLKYDRMWYVRIFRLLSTN